MRQWLGRLPVGDIGVAGTKRVALPFRVPPSLDSGTWHVNYRIKSSTDDLRYSNNEGTLGRLLLRNVAPTEDEPNESAAQATFLTEGGLAEGRDPTPLHGGLAFKTLHSISDKDYYSVVLDSFAGSGSRIGLDFDDDLGEVEMRLLDPDGREAGQSRVLGPGQFLIEMDYLPQGAYTLEVVNGGSTRIEYTLSYVMYPRGLPKDSTDGDALENEVPVTVTNVGSFTQNGALFTTGDTDVFAFAIDDWAAEGSHLDLTHEAELGRLALWVVNDDVVLTLPAESSVMANGDTRTAL